MRNPQQPADCRPTIAIIVAMTRNGVIGQAGRLPWDLPADRRLFRQLTTGNTVIMGRLTFASLPGALAERHNLVVSRTSQRLPGATVCPGFRDALAVGGRLGRPIFVIGGVELYRQALPIADTLYVSWVDGDYPGDRHFPPFDQAAWQPVATTAYPGFQHVVYRRTGAVRPGERPQTPATSHHP
jgi:dihydrofolate reductase